MESRAEKRDFFRKKCLNELLSSEESYLHHLSLLVELFYQPIIDHELVPTKLSGLIFGNISAIQTINVRLCEELRRHFASDTIGQAFLKIAPYLKAYADYAKNFEHAQMRLANYENENPGFKQYIEKQESQSEMNGLKLNSLLITPIQRVPRYKLLLREVISYTDEKHPDYKDLIEAEQSIEEVALHINAHISQTSDIQALLKVQKALKNGRPQIFAPGRYLIKQGMVQKLSRRGNGEHKRHLILFNDMIIYCKTNSSNTTKPSSLECCCVMAISDCSVSRILGVIFKICCKEEKILFYANSPCECEIWVDKIDKAVRLNSEKCKTLKKETSSKCLKRKFPFRNRFNSLSVISRERVKKRGRLPMPSSTSEENPTNESSVSSSVNPQRDNQKHTSHPIVRNLPLPTPSLMKSAGKNLSDSVKECSAFIFADKSKTVNNTDSNTNKKNKPDIYFPCQIL